MFDTDDFKALLNRFVQALEQEDAAAFTACFTPDAVYDDVFYGAHRTRAGIEAMIKELWLTEGTDYRWEMFDPVYTHGIGYAHWTFSFTSRKRDNRRAVMTGASRFAIQGGLIREYREWCYDAAALAELGVPAEALMKRLAKFEKRMCAQADPVRHLLKP